MQQMRKLIYKGLNRSIMGYFLTALCLLFSLNGCKGNSTGEITKVNDNGPKITTIWLTFQRNKPSKIVINWKSENKGNSIVQFYIGNGKWREIKKDNNVLLHHVEIPFKKKDVMYYYRVITNNGASDTLAFKGFPSKNKDFRVAVIGNIGPGKPVFPNLTYLKKDNPHLLVTVGDNIHNLYDFCGAGNKTCVKPYVKLIKGYPKLFQSTPFLPTLGNHDHQIRKETKNPVKAVYDTSATAYRRFFNLPGDEWKWFLNIHNLNVTFISLDTGHINDYGTKLEATHNFHIGSPELKWYHRVVDKNLGKFIITLHNASNRRLRREDNGVWGSLFNKGRGIVISGNGYYYGIQKLHGVTYLNTSLNAGRVYSPDYNIVGSIRNYILLTFTGKKLMIQFKKLNGTIIKKLDFNLNNIWYK